MGTTGCGKTTLAEYLCSRFKYVVVWDAKGTINWNGYKLIQSFPELLKEFRSGSAERIIYRPSVREVRDEDIWDQFFWSIYERKNTCLYVDEVYSVVRGNTIPDGYHAILTRGRERGITAINSTQRPIRIPQEVLSEVENLYVFRLRLRQDIEKLNDIDDDFDPDFIRDFHDHEFLYSSIVGVSGPFRLKIK